MILSLTLSKIADHGKYIRHRALFVHRLLAAPACAAGFVGDTEHKTAAYIERHVRIEAPDRRVNYQQKYPVVRERMVG